MRERAGWRGVKYLSIQDSRAYYCSMPLIRENIRIRAESETLKHQDDDILPWPANDDVVEWN